ncbi:MAG: ATP-binding protein [Balneola sp.]
MPKNMDPSKLKESEVIEFKESFKDDALKSLCAFANTKGGSLFLGVKDDRTLIGGEITDKAQQKIINQIESGLGIQPNIIVHKHRKNEFLEIKVALSKVPVDVRGRFYKRVGNTTREIDREGLKELLLRDVPWDSQIREDLTQFNLNHAHIVPFAMQAQKKMIALSDDEFDNLDFLNQTGLVSGDSITNAALLLFGNKSAPKLSHAKIRIARLKGESTIIADYIIEGNLTNQIQESERVIKTLLNKRYKITGESFQRKEAWEYPIEAVREAILNALVHRNYHITNSIIEVKIYDNCVDFSNPGKLPEGISLDQLKRTHPSIRRNPLLAEALHRAGYIEQFGTGTLRMKESLRKAGHPEPDFSEEGNNFSVRFYAATEPVDPNSLDLNERQLKAIGLAREIEIQAADLQKHYPRISRKTITRDLTELVKLEVFEKIGKGKGTRYHLKFKQ